MKIEEQKVVSDKILEKMFSIDPFSIVAGGAPRDWHFGNIAADIDLFFYVQPNTQIGIIQDMLRSVGVVVESILTGQHIPEHYKMNPMIRCVFNTTIDGVDVQMILMKESTFKSVVDKFPLSICKAWYKNKKIYLEKDFIRSVKHNSIVKTNKLYANSHVYLNKILSKFPQFSYYESWDDLAKSILD